MASSGQYVRDVLIYAECPCDSDDGYEHDCDWHGMVDARIDPEDHVNGMDAVWTCPNCGCERETKEGAW